MSLYFVVFLTIPVDNIIHSVQVIFIFATWRSIFTVVIVTRLWTRLWLAVCATSRRLLRRDENFNGGV